MDNRYKMKQAYDLIRIPDEVNRRYAELASGEARAATGKPIKVRRGSTAIAAGLALVIAAGGTFTAVKLSSSSPDSISRAAFAPVSAENKYIRLTLTDIKSDGYIVKASFDLDRLYGSYAGKPFEDYVIHREGIEDYVVSFEEFDEYVNSLFNGNLRRTSEEGGVSTFYSAAAGQEPIKQVDLFDMYSFFTEETGSLTCDIDIDTSIYETCTFDRKVLAENIKLRADIEKNVESRKFVSEDGMVIRISELGICCEGDFAKALRQKIMDSTFVDNEDYQKKLYTVSVTDGNGIVTEAMLKDPVYYDFTEGESVPYSVLAGTLPIPADKIETITVFGTTFEAD